MSLSLAVPVFAAGAEYASVEPLGTTTIEANKLSIKPEETASPQLVMRETIGYDPTALSYNLTKTYVGSSSASNYGTNPLALTFQYETSGTVTASFASGISGSVQQNFVIA